MLVVHVCEATAGGVARHLSTLLPELQKRGIKNILIYSDQRRDSLTDHLEMILGEHGVEYSKTNMRRKVGVHDFLDVVNLWKQMRRIWSQYEAERDVLVHVHSAKAGALGRMVTLALKAPVVYNPHGLPTYRREGVFVSPIIYATVERVLSRYTDAIIACSEEEVREAGRLGYGAEKIFKILNALPQNYIKNALSKKRKKKTCPGGTNSIRVGFVGRLAPQKRPDLFVEAMGDVCREPCATGHMWGDGPLRELVVERIGQLNLSDRIFVHGWTATDVAYQNIEILVISSDYEGCSYVMLEAAAYGIPVVMTRVGGAEFIEENRAGIVVSPGDCSGIANAVRELIYDPEKRAEMGRRGRAAMKQQDGGWMAERTIEVYRSVLEKGGL